MTLPRVAAVYRSTGENNMTNPLLRDAISKALRAYGIAGASTLALSIAVPAVAQDAAQDASTQKLDTITVTGSNIRRVDIETSNPVITVDRAEIQKSGKLTVGDLLQQLPTIAGMANYSPSHFIRAFGSVYEETPHAFLIRRRLERARRLLRISPLAINEIALESGFENASAFSRLFRQRFGITAGTARRRNDAVDAAAV